MRPVNGLINSRGVHLILGIPAKVFNRQEALKQREAFCFITSTSSTCFRRKDQESFKVAEYPLLIRLEIHISLSNPNICQNLHSGLMCCHRQSILTLNLTLNKMKYTKPRYSSKKLNELNNFAPFSNSLYFGVILIGGVYQRGACNTILKPQRGRSLDKRCLFGSRRLLGHLRYREDLAQGPFTEN